MGKFIFWLAETVPFVLLGSALASFVNNGIILETSAITPEIHAIVGCICGIIMIVRNLMAKVVLSRLELKHLVLIIPNYFTTAATVGHWITIIGMLSLGTLYAIQGLMFASFFLTMASFTHTIMYVEVRNLIKNKAS